MTFLRFRYERDFKQSKVSAKEHEMEASIINECIIYKKRITKCHCSLMHSYFRFLLLFGGCKSIL